LERRWVDIRQRYPSFELLHGHGLGVAAVGKNVPTPIAKLIEMEQTMRYVIQDRFAQSTEIRDLLATGYKRLCGWIQERQKFFSKPRSSLQRWKRQGFRIACREEVAFNEGFIDRDQLARLGYALGKSGYARYLALASRPVG
jgi:dTDP-glucose pyrophosphorylase